MGPLPRARQLEDLTGVDQVVVAGPDQAGGVGRLQPQPVAGHPGRAGGTGAGGGDNRGPGAGAGDGWAGGGATPALSPGGGAAGLRRRAEPTVEQAAVAAATATAGTPRRAWRGRHTRAAAARRAPRRQPKRPATTPAAARSEAAHRAPVYASTAQRRPRMANSTAAGAAAADAGGSHRPDSHSPAPTRDSTSIQAAHPRHGPLCMKSIQSS